MNPQRGEYVLKVEGVGDVILRLSMGALAEIEAALECRTISDLIQRIASLGASDVIAILKILSRAGGNKDLPPVEDWPPEFSNYTVSIGECFFASGFLRKPKAAEMASPNAPSQ